MLTTARRTIYALIDELNYASGETHYMDVGQRFVPNTGRTQYVAAVRSGNVRGKNFPVFCDDGEQCLWACANTQEEADEKLAALCSVVTAA